MEFNLVGRISRNSNNYLRFLLILHTLRLITILTTRKLVMAVDIKVIAHSLLAKDLRSLRILPTKAKSMPTSLAF